MLTISSKPDIINYLNGKTMIPPRLSSSSGWAEMLEEANASRQNIRGLRTPKKYICEDIIDWKIMRVLTVDELRANPNFKRTTIQHITEICEDLVIKDAFRRDLATFKDEYQKNITTICTTLNALKKRSKAAHPILNLISKIVRIFKCLCLFTGLLNYRKIQDNLSITAQNLLLLRTPDGITQLRNKLLRLGTVKNIVEGLPEQLEKIQKDFPDEVMGKDLEEQYRDLILDLKPLHSSDASAKEKIDKELYVSLFIRDTDRGNRFTREDCHLKDEQSLRANLAAHPFHLRQEAVVRERAKQIDALLIHKNDAKWRYPIQAILTQTTLLRTYSFPVNFINMNLGVPNSWKVSNSPHEFMLNAQPLLEMPNIHLKINRKKEDAEIESIEVIVDVPIALGQQYSNYVARHVNKDVAIGNQIMKCGMRCTITLDKDGKPNVTNYKTRHTITTN